MAVELPVWVEIVVCGEKKLLVFDVCWELSGADCGSRKVVGGGG